tara:strand:+ start:675 stop:905 length:231 start_codon:yes stop_codon:yes gene_type:complete
MITKKRTINELRQVKDTIYHPPVSHEEAKLKNIKDRAIEYLLKSHSILFEDYPSSPRNSYVLSSISHLIDILKEEK